MTKSPFPAVNMETLSPFVQPYVRLAQRNIRLMTNFNASPEMVSIWWSSNQALFEQAMQGKTQSNPSRKVAEQIQKDVSRVSQSKAFSSLVRGLVQSQFEFFMDFFKTSMAAWGQAPVQMMKQVQQTTVKALPVRVA